MARDVLAAASLRAITKEPHLECYGESSRYRNSKHSYDIFLFLTVCLWEDEEYSATFHLLLPY